MDRFIRDQSEATRKSLGNYIEIVSSNVKKKADDTIQSQLFGRRCEGEISRKFKITMTSGGKGKWIPYLKLTWYIENLRGNPDPGSSPIKRRQTLAFWEYNKSKLGFLRVFYKLEIVFGKNQGQYLVEEEATRKGDLTWEKAPKDNSKWFQNPSKQIKRSSERLRVLNKKKFSK